VNLGTDITDFFSHADLWEMEVDGQVEQMRGFWYRVYFAREDFDFSNHSSIRSNPEAGEWIRDEILEPAGPYVGAAEVSGWERE
jgi:hypothetical protein